LNLLLDTHALLWWLASDRKLGPFAKKQVADPGNVVWVSAATAWEIAIKVGIGRLDLGEPPEQCLPREIERGGFRSLAVTVAHALAVRTLPRHHADPFDRLLIAQAVTDGLRIVTADSAFDRYGVATLAADK